MNQINKNKLAPIVLFVYNRLEHTRRTIEALQKNIYASDSLLFIYSDGAKNESAQKSVDEVRAYIHQVSGFKNVILIEQEENKGLADSIINGVTEVVNQYGKVIVLEDDLVTSPYFLKFMNEALEFYKYKTKVWHISGWNYPIETDSLGDVFLWRLMNCWGWATWADRWQYFEKNVHQVMKEFNKEDIYRFNLNGDENFFGQVVQNYEKKINTWAIFWYVTIFKNNGLCLNPTKSFVDNIGHDGSGVHCGESELFATNLSLNNSINFTSNLIENDLALERIQKFYKSLKKPFFTRAINKIARTIMGRNLIK